MQRAKPFVSSLGFVLALMACGNDRPLATEDPEDRVEFGIPEQTSAEPELPERIPDDELEFADFPSEPSDVPVDDKIRGCLRAEDMPCVVELSEGQESELALGARVRACRETANRACEELALQRFLVRFPEHSKATRFRGRLAELRRQGS